MSRGPKLAVAAALGLLAALFGMLYLSSERSRILGNREIVEVYVAADDIPANASLNGAKLTTRKVPRAFLQPQAITTAEVTDRSKVTGVTIVPIRENEQIVRTKLWEGKTPPLADDLRLRPNMVAVSVEMKGKSQALQGLVQPRDRVDVLAVLEFVKPTKEKFKEVRPLFQNVEVLAVNRTTTSSVSAIANAKTDAELVDKVETVTLALPPTAAQQLILAQQLPSSSIWLVLRSAASGNYTYDTWNTDRLVQSEYRLWDESEASLEAQQEMMRRMGGR